MKEFLLNYNDGINFSIFNNYHYLLLTITFIISLLVLFNCSFFKNLKVTTKKKIRIVYGLILLILFIVRRGSFLYFGVYDWTHHLDIGFCNFINLLLIVYCFIGNKKIYNVCYYGIFMGPLTSIMFPVINIGMNNYAFIVFLIIHNITFIMNIVFAIFEDIQYSKKKFISTLFVFLIYYFLILTFNNIFDTNYNLLNNLLSNSLKNITVLNVILSNRFLEAIFMIIFMIILMFIGSRLLTILKGGTKNEN